MIARPVLFSAPMVIALLAGRKTQTRRVAKCIPWLEGANPQFSQARAFVNSGEWRIAGGLEMTRGFHCPFGQPGDLLWVRETHAIVGTVDPGFILYKASGYEDECKRHGLENYPPECAMRWTPSIHMPRWASRLTLRITDVRVQRLKDISQAEAIAEGAPPSHPSIDAVSRVFGYEDFSRSWFAQLFESIYGDGAWTVNPWVWAVSFEVIHKNVDEVAP